jgi:hypothetical protein
MVTGHVKDLSRTFVPNSHKPRIFEPLQSLFLYAAHYISPIYLPDKKFPAKNGILKSMTCTESHSRYSLVSHKLLDSIYA